jgi:hypothetical protein
MKTYVLVTGILFALLTLVHVWRMMVERQLANDPWYLGITALAALLSLWAWRVLRRSRASSVQSNG